VTDFPHEPAPEGTSISEQAARQRELEAEVKRQRDAEQASQFGGWGLILILIVAPIAWLGFHEARLARIAVLVGVISVIVGVVKSTGGAR
jgi:hypothetical protein